MREKKLPEYASFFLAVLKNNRCGSDPVKNGPERPGGEALLDLAGKHLDAQRHVCRGTDDARRQR